MRPIRPACVHRPPDRTSTPAAASNPISRPMNTPWWGSTTDSHVSRTNPKGDGSAKSS